jgi:hypothetical protein
MRPAKRTSRHRRTSSVEIASSLIPRIESTTTVSYSADAWTNPWESDDSIDEEVPLPTLLEATMRRARAHAHVTTRLYALRVEASEEKALLSALDYDASPPFVAVPMPEFTHEGFETADLGLICPNNWRTTDWEGVLLDRTWLHSLNPTIFNEEGVLVEPVSYIKKPKCVPLLYWRWLKGEESRDCESWAEGWTREGPTMMWVQRWRMGELTKKEWDGRRRVGFVIEVDVLEF